ncbi:MAG: hypothetical protein AAFY83_05705 [Pseudomonadota bacterium]
MTAAATKSQIELNGGYRLGFIGAISNFVGALQNRITGIGVGPVNNINTLWLMLKPLAALG